MSIEDAADRAIFVDPDDFGAAITWTRGATPSTFNAIFSRPTLLVDAGEQTLIDRDASLICREADLPTGAIEGDAIAVAGETVSFLCQAIRPDGQGMATIDLRRA